MRTAIATFSCEGTSKFKLDCLVWRETEEGCECEQKRDAVARMFAAFVSFRTFRISVLHDDVLAPGSACDSATKASRVSRLMLCYITVTYRISSWASNWALRHAGHTYLQFWLAVALTLQLGKTRQNPYCWKPMHTLYTNLAI